MPKETIIEHAPWVPAELTGTITTAIGSPNLVGVGTLFTAELAVNSIVYWTDDNGLLKMGQVASITNDLLLALHNNCISVATGVSPIAILAANQTVSFFRADNGAINAPLIRQAFAQAALQANGKSLISEDEGVLLKSVFIRMPYQYTLADSIYILRFYYADGSNNSLGAISEIGEGLGEFQIPVENIETPVNIYIPPPVTPTNTWQIMCQFLYARDNLGIGVTPFDVVPRVSQIDGPDNLNSVFLAVFAGARIEHASIALT